MKKLLALIVLVGLGTFLWYRHGLGPVDTSSQMRDVVRIPEGSSALQIASILKEQGLIRSELAFRLYASWHDLDDTLQAGSYALRSSMTVPEMLTSLAKGIAQEAIVTIPEGFTVADIDALLAEKGLTKAGDVLTCAEECDFTKFSFLPTKGDRPIGRGGQSLSSLEGYLFPDTYFVIVGSFKPEDFLGRLLSTFEKRVVQDLAKDIAASNRKLEQIVTMASLVEKETRTEEERPVVAGILWRRLDARMGLDVDATIRYALGKPTDALTRDDLDTDSPYNTRKHRGLPPGPIASPGIASIKAALHPEESKYLYYLHGKDSVIRYAQTNDEHNENKRRYLK